MKKTKILYVYGYGDSPDSDIFNKLKERLDKTKFEIISDYYAQYSPKEAIYDINNLIKTNNIDLVIGENLGGYLVTLLDNDLQKIIIDPIFNPVYELDEYELDGLKIVPDHIIKFYKESELKPIYNDNICAMFSNTNNYEDYKKNINNCHVYLNVIESIIEQLNNI